MYKKYFFLGPWDNEALRLRLQANVAAQDHAVLMEPKGADFIILEKEEDRSKLSKGFRGRAVTLEQIRMLKRSINVRVDF